MSSEPLNSELNQPVPLNTLLESALPPVQPDVVRWAGVSVEWLAYLALVLLSVVFRLADVDAVPLNDIEATRALAAWHMVYPAAPGTALPADSPVTFWLQYAAFSILGGNELSARLPGVIGGIVLILLPLLFRGRLGRARTFLLSLVLAASPIGLVASRTADPTVWTVIFAVLTLWAFWRYYETRRPIDIAMTAGFGAALVFLSEPGGLLLLIIVALAGLVAIWWTAWSAPQDLALENPVVNIFAQAGAVLAGIPWRLCAGVIVVVVLVASTLFMFHPAGLSMVGEVLGDFLRGFWLPVQPDVLPGYPVLTLLLFDPLLILFGIIGITLLINREKFGFRERFLFAWFVAGVVVLVLYRGGTPGYALWLALPLAVLALEAALELFSYRPVLLFLFDDLMAENEEITARRYAWIKYAAGLVAVALLVMMAVHWQEIGRGLVSLSLNLSFSDAVNMLMEQPYAMFRYSLIWFIISLMFFIVGYMMAASVWGHQPTLQGLGMGLFVMMLVSGVGGGWHEAVVKATEPGILWTTAAVSPEAPLLRQTLFEVARRNTRGFAENMHVTVLVDEPKGIRQDGLLAWLLRDYPNARFVKTLEDARQDEIVLMAPMDAPPDLGGTYVGQSFRLRTHWTLNFLSAGDLPAWFALRRIRLLELPQDVVVLWLRSDIFNASPLSEIPQ